MSKLTRSNYRNKGAIHVICKILENNCRKKYPLNISAYTSTEKSHNRKIDGLIIKNNFSITIFSVLQ